MAFEDGLDTIQQQKILRNIAEDVKLALLRITNESQLARQSLSPNLDQIETTADGAMRLLDSYILSAQVAYGQQELELQPTSVAAVMQDVSIYLSRMATQHGGEIIFEPKRSYGLAMADKAALQAALIGLAYSFIASLSQKSAERKSRVVFTVSKTKDNIQAGVFSSSAKISSRDLERVVSLAGSARQLMPDFSHTSSAGFLIAGNVCAAMNARLTVAKRKSMQGVIVNLLPSQQLALL